LYGVIQPIITAVAIDAESGLSSRLNQEILGKAKPIGLQLDVASGNVADEQMQLIERDFREARNAKGLLNPFIRLAELFVEEAMRLIRTNFSIGDYVQEVIACRAAVAKVAPVVSRKVNDETRHILPACDGLRSANMAFHSSDASEPSAFLAPLLAAQTSFAFLGKSPSAATIASLASLFWRP
jgi:hypothetical protein